MSGNSTRHFSREGFRELQNTMGNPNDATIDIPLHHVNSRGQTGARKDGSVSPSAAYGALPSFPDQPTEKSINNVDESHFAGLRRVRGLDIARQDTDDSLDGQGTLTRMGRIYDKMIHFSFITRYLIFVLPLAAIFAIPIIVGCTVAPDAKIGTVRIIWIFTWVEVVWLSLWVSKSFSKLIPHIFEFLCGIVSSGVRKYSLILKALEIPLSLVGWALASLITFKPLMQHNPDTRAAKAKAAANNETWSWPEWETIVTQVLAAAVIAALIFLAERFLIQLISISYHRKQFHTRIKGSKRNLYLLGLLYDASIKLFPAYCREFMEEDYIINDDIDIGILKARTRHNRASSANPLRLIQNVGRVGDKVTAAFGNVAKEITGKKVFDPTSAHSVIVEALEKNSSAEALARRLWMSFVCESKDALYLEDVVEVLGLDRKEEAEEAFAAIDRDGNGDISLDEMIMTVCEIARTRRSISTSMHDVDAAIHVLDNLLCTAVFIVVVFIFVAFLNKNFTTTLATAGTTLLSLSFVFSATCQEVLGSCIFLFVKHPYDVGDRVDVSDVQYTVDHISLLFTVFRQVSSHKTTQMPNNILNGLSIDNVSRSVAMREQLTMYISFDTSLEDIHLLKNELLKFVLDKENSRDFLPEVEVEVTGISEMNKLELKVDICHKSNWANESVRAARRSKFMCALVLALRRIPINAPGGGSASLGDAANPSYSVTISDDEAAKNKAKYDEDKEGKRMVPSKKTDSSSDTRATGSDPLGRSNSGLRNRSTDYSNVPASEKMYLETLNARAPGLDLGRDVVQNYNAPTSRSDSSSTLGDDHVRSPVENDERSSLLQRASTQGRRKAGASPNMPTAAMFPAPPVPTIAEPTPPPMTSPTARQPVPSFHEYTPTIASSMTIGLESVTSPTSPNYNNPYAQRIQYQQQMQSPTQNERDLTSQPTRGNENAFAQQSPQDEER
ncbi:MAG: hypothetical protein M1834_007734 [Cirrosporium novae-zelandiae]|nr:MAG: hypothetical protein M1834_007734 [Cirrosporium novae-zelandiae]